MIKTISYWSIRGGLEGERPIVEALADVKAADFPALELCIGEQGVLSVTTTRAECEEIRRQVDSAAVIVETLASGMSWGCNPVSDDDKTRARSFELHAAALKRASWLGCQALLYVPGVVGGPICPDEAVRYDRAVARAGETIRRLLDVAEANGVDLLIENVWNGMFYSPIELAQFVDSFDSDRLGVYFDVGNVLGYHQDPSHWIEILGPHIRRVHVKDFKKDIGTLDGFCDLLDGDVRFSEVIAALDVLGYRGTLVAEMIPWSDGLLERTSAAMDRILSLSRGATR